MFEKFTDRTRKIMALANQETQRYDHEYIGTQHILLALLKEGSGVAANMLKNLGVDLRMARLEVEKLVNRGPEVVTEGKLPQTPRAKKVIENAIEEARILKCEHVDTEHLLLGLLREMDSAGCQVLMNLGLRPEQIREEVLSLLGAENEEEEEPREQSKEPATTYQVFGPLTILIDPGQATAEDIGELFFRLSHLYKLIGGSGLEFRTLDVREGVGSHV